MKKLLLISLVALSCTNMFAMEQTDGAEASTPGVAEAAGALAARMVLNALTGEMVPLSSIQPLYVAPTEISTKTKAPIVVMHGMTSNATNQHILISHIRKAFPDAYIVVPTIPLCERQNLTRQCQWLADFLRKDSKLQNGVTLMGHSQGGLLMRKMIEDGVLPKVLAYISIASPQRGVAGFPGDWDDPDWKDKDKNAFTKLVARMQPLIDKIEDYAGPFAMYAPPVQKRFSPSGLYNSPFVPKAAHILGNPFLAQLNNQYLHPHVQTYKDNLTKVGRVVCIQATEEIIVEPPASEWFGYYRRGSDKAKNVKSVTQSGIYTQLGLDQLAARQAFFLLMAKGTHSGIADSEENFKTNIAPFIADADEAENAPRLTSIPLPEPVPSHRNFCSLL